MNKSGGKSQVKKKCETSAADLLTSDLHRRTNNMKKFTDQFFREIPKTDLHVHLDGSIRIETLVELAKEQNFELPKSRRPALSCVRLLDTYTPHTYRYNVSELKKTVFKDNYKNLEEYLEGFKYTSGVMQDSKSC